MKKLVAIYRAVEPEFLIAFGLVVGFLFGFFGSLMVLTEPIQ